MRSRSHMHGGHPQRKKTCWRVSFTGTSSPNSAIHFSRPTNLSTLIDMRYTRRRFFDQIGLGFTGLALGSVLAEAGLQYDVFPKKPHFAPKARRVLMLFQNGGPSHVDMFDPKGELLKRQG